MDQTYQIIAAIAGAAMVLLIAPRVLANNKGKILQNTALWVGIFLLLALAYKTVGPGKNDAPSSIPSTTIEEKTESDKDTVFSSESEPKVNEGYSPPNE